jgi:hypothetical protein
MLMRGRLALALFILPVLTAASDPDKPKSNMFARAKLLSANELSVTIRHSSWGTKAAFQFAADHCAKYGKLAIVQNGIEPKVGDGITTWMCVAPPPAPQPPTS